MEFCKKCSSLLVPKKGKLSCPKCGFKKKPKHKQLIKEEFQPRYVEVIEDREYGDSTVPIVCWNCKKRGVYVKVLFNRSDEAPLRMYKCANCKKVWRSSK